MVHHHRKVIFLEEAFNKYFRNGVNEQKKGRDRVRRRINIIWCFVAIEIVLSSILFLLLIIGIIKERPITIVVFSSGIFFLFLFFSDTLLASYNTIRKNGIYSLYETGFSIFQKTDINFKDFEKHNYNEVKTFFLNNSLSFEDRYLIEFNLKNNKKIKWGYIDKKILKEFKNFLETKGIEEKKT
jgi:hypothetical protein